LLSGQIDAVAFASPSAVDGFRARLDMANLDFELASVLPAACIGESTAERAVELGFASVTAARRPSVDGLVDALESALAPTREGAVPCR
jgi:uroporphyrinogen-III synthase